MHRKPLAYAAYQELADHYAAMIDTKPHNAYYDRPAMLQLWPNLQGKRCLDAGCGPGAYAEALLDRGAEVVAVDVSDRMLELAMQRVGYRATFRLMDLSTPGLDFADAEFDFINAPLCFDYIEDWDVLLKECHRILKPHGLIQISCGHPAFEAEYYKTNRYFSIEAVQCTCACAVASSRFERPWAGWPVAAYVFVHLRPPTEPRVLTRCLCVFVCALFLPLVSLEHCYYTCADF